MLNITVKTLDGSDHKFTVEDVMTVKEFKDHIAETTGIVSARQRLIFKGHVLLDDKKLTDVGADGNVLHLVERPENSRGIQGNGQPRRSTTQRGRPFPLPINNFTLQEIEESVRRTVVRLGVEERNLEITASHAGFGAIDTRIVVRNPTAEDSDSPARARIQHIRTVLRHVNHILHHLEHDDVDESTTRDVDADITVVPPECQDEAHEESEVNSVQGDDSASSIPSLVTDSENEATIEGGNSTSPRTRHSHVWDLTTALTEILRVQDRLRPQLEIYQRMLRNEEDYTNNLREGRRVSRFFNGIQVALHNLSHVMHVFSDLNIHFCEPPPRRLYPQLGPIPPDQHASTEVQINLRFQSGPAGSGQPAGGQRAAGGAEGGTAGAAPGGTAVNAQATPTRRVIPVSSQGPQGDMQGLLSMEMSPNGSMVINGVAITTQANETTTGAQSGPSTTNAQSGQASSTTSSATAGGTNASGTGPQAPGNQPAHLFQQIMQGIVGSTTGSLGMAGGRGQTGAGGQARPGGPTPIPPTFAFPGAAAAAGMGGGRGIRASFQMGSAQLPLGMQNLPQGMPFPMFQQRGHHGPARGNLRGRFGNPPTHGRGRGRGRGHGHSHAHPRPAQQPHHHHHHHNPHNVGGTMHGSPGIFVGPAPPSELPLYTIDPHLPCPSRHFDPRLIRERQQRRTPASSAQTTTAPNPAASAASAEPQPSAPSAPSSDTAAESGSGGRSDFEAALEQQMRPVIRNMFLRPNIAPRSTAADRQPQQMYSFQPVSVGNQSFGMSATPIMMDEEEGAEGEAMDVDQPEAQDRERNNSDSTEGEEFEDAVEGDWDPMQAMMSGIMNNMAGQGTEQTLGDFVRSMGMEDMALSGEGLARELYRTLASTVTFRDIITIFAGDTSPLNNQRTRIRRFVIDNVLNGNDRPSEEDLHSAAVRICESQSTDEELLQGVQPRQPHLDIMASLNRCELVAVEDILRLIFGYGEGTNFGQDIYDRLKRFLRELMVLGSRCCANGQADFEGVLRRYLCSMDQGVQHLRSVMESGDISEADVEQYVVIQTPEETTTQPTGRSTSSISDPTMDTESPTEQTQKVVSETVVGDRGAGIQEAVPDEMISWRQSLPQQWVGVIEEDMEKQTKTPVVRRPFSDAYLSGVDPKRRKMILNDTMPRLDGDSKLDLRTTLAEGICATNVKPVTGELPKDVLAKSDIDTPLSNAYQTELDSQIRRRLQNDPDFTPEKFPAAFKHFKP